MQARLGLRCTSPVTRIAVAALATITLFAACGDDDTSSTSDGTTGGGGAGGPGALRIGVLVNETGPLPSGEENATPVLEAWVEAVNADGGIAGHDVELVVEDTKGDAPTATSAVERLVGDESVAGLVIFDAATEGLVADAITEGGLPVIGGMGYAPDAWGARPNWFPLTTSIPSIFNMGIVLADSLDAERTALTICAEIAGCAEAGAVVEQATETLGMTYAGTLPVSAAAPDYTAECLKIIDEEVDYVMLGAATATAALRVAADCTTQGYDGTWGLFGGVIVPQAMRENDPGVDLHLALNAFPWFSEAEPVVAYRALMEDQDVAEEDWADPHATAAYATMELLEAALAATPGGLPAAPTRADVIAAYGQVADEDLDGLLAQPVTFTPDAPQPTVTCYWFGRFAGGEFTDASPEPVCDPASLAAGG